MPGTSGYETIWALESYLKQAFSRTTGSSYFLPPDHHTQIGNASIMESGLCWNSTIDTNLAQNAPLHATPCERIVLTKNNFYYRDALLLTT